MGQDPGRAADGCGRPPRGIPGRKLEAIEGGVEPKPRVVQGARPRKQDRLPRHYAVGYKK